MKTANKTLKMKKTKNLITGILILSILAVSLVSAADRIEYDFDEVNVLYAVQFEASPELNQARSGDLKQEDWYSADQTWLEDIITDSNPNITVIFGVVELKKEGYEPFKEEFIKIEGEKGSRRFLMTSGRWDYYEGTNKLMRIYSLFWSAKVLKGNVVIKDFTKPIDSVIFMRKMLPSGEATNFYLSFFTGTQENAINKFNEGNFPIMYSLYKSIAEFGEASATTGDNTNSGKDNTIKDDTNLSENTTTEDNTNISGSTTTGDNTAFGSNNTAGNNTNISGNTTTENNTNTGENNTTGNNTNIGGNTTTGNDSAFGSNNTAGNNTNLEGNTTAGDNITVEGN